MTQQAKDTTPPRNEVSISPPQEKRLPSPGPFELVAIDLEGTLLRPDKAMSKCCVDVIRAAVQRDIKVVIAAASAPAGMVKVYQHLGLRAPQICFNGAVVYDPHGHTVLFHDPIPPENSEKIIRLARSTDNKATIKIEIIDHKYVDDIGTNPGLARTSADSYMSGSLGALGKVISEPVTKITLTSSPVEIERMKRRINQLLPGRVTFLASDTHILQMVNCGVGKGTALMQIADYLRIDPENVMAIGDGINDIEMIRWAGMGVAMGNAHSSVKQAAHFVGPSNLEDGVAVVVSRYALR